MPAEILLVTYCVDACINFGANGHLNKIESATSQA